MRDLRCEIEQRPDRRAGALARPQFQHLPEQDERDDDGGGLEIETHPAMMIAKGGRKGLRRKGADHRVGPSDAGAEGDEREHIEATAQHALPAAHEEWPATPEYYWCREDELDPVRSLLVVQVIEPEHVATHLERRHRHSQSGPNPEPPLHVDQLVAWPFVEARLFRLQCHAADRTTSRPDLPDLRMHGAGVDRPRRRCRCRPLARHHILRRIGDELLAALRRTEVVCRALVRRPMRGRFRVDLHSANRIRRRGGSTVIGTMAMVPMLIVVILV